jgi:hypothetical protein
MTALGRSGQPQDIADVVALLVGKAARWITGQHVRANGGLIRAERKAGGRSGGGSGWVQQERGFVTRFLVMMVFMSSGKEGGRKKKAGAGWPRLRVGAVSSLLVLCHSLIVG